MVGAADDARFFRTLAIIMAAVLVFGFSVQLAMGRSSFAAPLVVHVHAVVFMAWLGIFVAQSWLAVSGRIAQHRWLGRLAAGWTLLMLVMGVGATVGAVQQGRVPFFFLPQHFLIADIATLVCFAGLTAMAIRWRRQTDWHWRLHLCAMAALMGPGFGRLLPMPFMTPWAFEIAALCGLVFPAIAAARDARRGDVHPAWALGVGALLLTLALAWGLGHSAWGATLYDAVVAGTPGAAFPGLTYPPPPPGM